MNQQFVEKISQQIPQLNLRFDEPMKKHTTFRIGGPADLYAEPDKQQLIALAQLAKDFDVPVTIIGNGSNLLVGDKGVRGLVISIGKGMSGIFVDGNIITAGAGAMLSAVANKAASASLGGMEFAAGIPGSVGGAVVMNAGAYGGEIKDIIKNAEVLTTEGRVVTLSSDELGLSYRHSCIPQNGYVVLEATYELEHSDESLIREAMAQLRKKRVEKQPLDMPSAGSTFKRPQGYFAGKLIMDAGLRGYSVGDAQISEKHCGFAVNKGNATAKEMLALINDVQSRVKAQFGVDLETEVKMIGDF